MKYHFEIRDKVSRLPHVILVNEENSLAGPEWTLMAWTQLTIENSLEGIAEYAFSVMTHNWIDPDKFGKLIHKGTTFER